MVWPYSGRIVVYRPYSGRIVVYSIVVYRLYSGVQLYSGV